MHTRKNLLIHTRMCTHRYVRAHRDMHTQAQDTRNKMIISVMRHSASSGVLMGAVSKWHPIPYIVHYF